MNETARPNLARRDNGCWVITSSNANFDRLYSEGLNDGKGDTAWRSFRETTEEWAELRWDFEMFVDTVKVYPHERGRPGQLVLYAWLDDEWREIAAQSGTQLERAAAQFRFDVLRTKRLRLVMRHDEAQFSGLWEIQAFGPPQPLIAVVNQRGRWDYVPVSRPKVTGGQETLIVEEVRLDPPTAKPGSHVVLTCRFKPPAKLSDDHVLIVTLGERETYYSRSDYTVTRVILMPDEPPSTWPAGESQTVRTDVYIPAHAPDGPVDVMLHSTSPAGRPALRLVDALDKPLDDGKAAVLDVRRFASRPGPDRTKHVTRIDHSNGATVISIDGKRVAPILFALQTPSLERFDLYTRAAGVKLYHLQIYPFRIDVGDYQTRNYQFVAGHVRQMLRVDPDAYAIIQMDLRTTPAWREENPGGVLVSHDGTRHHESFCSKEYRRELVSYVSNLVKFVEAQPWGNRVVGYLCEIGEPEGVLSGGEIGDYNPQAIEAFREFVRQRYAGDDARLRKAYDDPKLTFDEVYPTPAKIGEAGYRGGCFLDPATQRLTIDYHEFLASIIPQALTELCGGTIKRLTNGRVLVGSYWAYLLEDITAGAGSHQKTHSHVHHVLASPNIDFFASPFNYWVPARHAGEPYLTFQPHDAVRINGKLHIPEMDHRTFRSGPLDRGRNYSRDESIALIRRDLGTALLHGMGAWMSDWSSNDQDDRRLSEAYFTDDRILEQVNSLREVYQKTIDLDRSDTPEVAVFVSGTSYYYHDNNARPIYGDLIRTTLYYNMNVTGVPYDILLFEDLLKPEVREGYKCFIFLNAFYMTDEQRAVAQGLKRDGNALVWLYAPGYASETDLSLKRVSELTGFDVQAEHERQRLSFRVVASDHPIVRGVPDEPLGGRSGPVSPRFHVTAPDAGTSVLGEYADGKIALAAKDLGTHKSVYCAVPYLSTALLRNVIRYAGCHIYVERDMYLDATRNFLMLTNSFEKSRNLLVRLPRKCRVSELASGRPVADGADSLQVTIEPGRTLLYRLE